VHHLVSALSSTTGSSYQHPKGNVKRLRRRSSRKRRTGCIESTEFARTSNVMAAMASLNFISLAAGMEFILLLSLVGV